MRLAREAYRRADLLEQDGTADPELVAFLRDCAERLDELEYQLRDVSRALTTKKAHDAR